MKEIADKPLNQNGQSGYAAGIQSGGINERIFIDCHDKRSNRDGKCCEQVSGYRCLHLKSSFPQSDIHRVVFENIISYVSGKNNGYAKIQNTKMKNANAGAYLKMMKINIEFSVYDYLTIREYYAIMQMAKRRI